MAMSVLGLPGCTNWTPQYANVAPVTGPAPYANRTPMQSALVCLQASTRATPDIRLGVADFVDGSGASMGESDVNGRYFSQRPDLMLIVALSKTGVRLVNRTSTAVAEWEMRQAMDRRLGEGKPVVVGQTRFDYRPVRAGEFLGSTFYVNGAITEINWSLSSNVEEAGFLGATAGRRTYRVSIAVDLVVTNSLTTEVVFARSYSKQLVGSETGAGVFRFVEASIMPKSRVELFQANIGQKQNEPVQAALRWLVELAGYETVSALTGGDARCDALVPGQTGEDGEDDAVFPSANPVQVPAQMRAGDGAGRAAEPPRTAAPRPAAPAAVPPPQVSPAPLAPVSPAPVSPGPMTRTRAPMPAEEAPAPGPVPRRARMAEERRRAPAATEVEPVAATAMAVAAASLEQGDAEGDSRQHLPPAPLPRALERSEERQGVQPEQPSGRIAILAAIQAWLSAQAGAAFGPRHDVADATTRPTGTTDE